MSSRIELQNMLEEILGSRNVYFQPPASVRLKYPCVIYSLKDMRPNHANNRVYNLFDCYELIYIDSDPDNKIARELAKVVTCRFDRFYEADNLNHYVYTLYF